MDGRHGAAAASSSWPCRRTAPRIWVGGDFNTIGGQARNKLAAVHGDGSVDPALQPRARQRGRRLDAHPVGGQHPRLLRRHLRPGEGRGPQQPGRRRRHHRRADRLGPQRHRSGVVADGVGFPRLRRRELHQPRGHPPDAPRGPRHRPRRRLRVGPPLRPQDREHRLGGTARRHARRHPGRRGRRPTAPASSSAGSSTTSTGSSGPISPPSSCRAARSTRTSTPASPRAPCGPSTTTASRNLVYIGGDFDSIQIPSGFKGKRPDHDASCGQAPGSTPDPAEPLHLGAVEDRRLRGRHRLCRQGLPRPRPRPAPA